MNIMNLIQHHPLLFADLKGLGLPTITIQRVADELSMQLGGSKDFNLCFVLSALDRRRFLDATDVAEIAKATSLPRSSDLVLAPLLIPSQSVAASL